nr:ABC transporter substrate-binding protein [uncultured Cohaesibacter sp.]
MKLVASLMGLLLLSAPALAQTQVQSCNRTVSFDAPPTRAVSNDINMTEMMVTLGLQDHMAGYTGISRRKMPDDELMAKLKGLPELSPDHPTKEVLVGADADFFFAGWNYGMKVGGEITPETLAPFGIKAYELTESCIHIGPKSKISMDDMYIDLLNLGKIFNVEDKAIAIVEGFKKEIADVKASLPIGDRPLRVFVYDSGEDTPFTAAKYAMPTALIEEAGGHNVMDNIEKSWTKATWEKVVDANPEVIVIINYGSVTAEQKHDFMMNNPAFANIDAVKNDRFVTLGYVEATPGPRNIRAIKKLAKAFWGQ